MPKAEEISNEEKPRRKTSESQLRANEKHQKEKLDRMVFYVPKGMKDQIKAKANSLGKSPNKFIYDLIEAAMGED